MRSRAGIRQELESVKLRTTGSHETVNLQIEQSQVEETSISTAIEQGEYLGTVAMTC